MRTEGARLDETELRDWMTRNGRSVRQLAQELEVNPATVQRWRDGSYRIPKAVELALKTLEQAN